MRKNKLVAAAVGVIAALLVAVPGFAASQSDGNKDGLPDRWEKRHDLSPQVKQAKKNPEPTACATAVSSAAAPIRATPTATTTASRTDADGDGECEGKPHGEPRWRSPSSNPRLLGAEPVAADADVARRLHFGGGASKRSSSWIWSTRPVLRSDSFSA